MTLQVVKGKSEVEKVAFAEIIGRLMLKVGAPDPKSIHTSKKHCLPQHTDTADFVDIKILHKLKVLKSYKLNPILHGVFDQLI